MDLDCVPYLTRIMDLCRKQGVALNRAHSPATRHDIGKVNTIGNRPLSRRRNAARLEQRLCLRTGP